MSKLPTFLSAFDKLLAGHPVYFTNSLLIVLSAGGEKFFQSVAFQCPKDPKIASWYGWIFFLAPPLILLVFGIFLTESLWRVCHGCNNSEKDLSQGRLCSSFCVAFVRSLIVPSAWLFVSLLDGTYIVCSLVTEPDKETEETLRIKAYTQIAGWIFLVVVVLVGTISTCCIRCRDKRTFLERRYIEVYKQVEKGELEKKMNEKAQKIAEENVNSLFSRDLPPKKTWDQITLPIRPKVSKNSYYSPLHKWSAKAIVKNDGTKKCEESDTTKKGPSTQKGVGSVEEGNIALTQLGDSGTKSGGDTSTKQEQKSTKKGTTDSTQQ